MSQSTDIFQVATLLSKGTKSSVWIFHITGIDEVRMSVCKKCHQQPIKKNLHLTIKYALKPPTPQHNNAKKPILRCCLIRSPACSRPSHYVDLCNTLWKSHLQRGRKPFPSTASMLTLEWQYV